MSKKYVVTANGKVIEVSDIFADNELIAVRMAVQPLTIPQAYNLTAALAHLQHSLGITCTVVTEEL